MRNHSKHIILTITLCLLIALIGHAYPIYKRLFEGITQVGAFDQTSQMIQFKAYLYRQFTQGQFFYDFNGNVGGDFFNRLSYYFSTSIFFYITAFITFLLESIGLIKTVNLTYWADSILIVSIFRSACILYFTQKYLSYFKLSTFNSYLGACFYTFTIIYFRHVAAWEFFADAMVWLPILFLGIEKIINKDSGRYFAIGVGLTLFNNAYFAYINLVLVGIYILIRWFIPINKVEAPKRQQMLKFTAFGLLGLGIALPGFIAFVIGFTQTIRPNIIKFSIDWGTYDLTYLRKLLLTSDIFVAPILSIFLLSVTNLFGKRLFKFAALSSILLMCVSFVPFVGSIFNGFSDPQYRWNYGIHLFLALVITVALDEIPIIISNQKNNPIKIWIGIIAISCIYVYLLFIIEPFQNKWLAFFVGLIITIIGITGLFIFTNKKSVSKIIGLILISGHLLSIIPNLEYLTDHHRLHSIDYFKTLDNSSSDMNQSLDYISSESRDFDRIDVFNQGISFPRNSLLVKDFNTNYLYSSFQNKEQQLFEEYFQIDPYHARNTGEVLGPNGRKVLMSLLNVDRLVMHQTQNQNLVPSTFILEKSFGNVNIYKNKYPFPYIHPVHHIYDSHTIDKTNNKDLTLIDGALVNKHVSKLPFEAYPTSNDVLDYTIDIKDAHYVNKILTPKDKEAPMTVIVQLDKTVTHKESINISYSLKPLNHGYSSYKVNDIVKTRISENILYGSKQYAHQIELTPNKQNQIIFEIQPNNQFEFIINQITPIPDYLLKQAAIDLSNLDYDLNINNHGIDIHFDNSANYKFMTLPIFMSKGLDLEINQKPREIFNSNYGLVGFELKEGINHIKLRYQQPYFKLSCFIAIACLLVLFLPQTIRLNRLKL